MAGKRRRTRGSKKHGEANEKSPSTPGVVSGHAIQPYGTNEEDLTASPPPLMNDKIPVLNEETTITQGDLKMLRMKLVMIL